jgi:hypothetical protein
VPAAAQTIDEDMTLTFASGKGNGISIADADAYSTDEDTTLIVSVIADGVLKNDTDPDTAAASLQAVLVGGNPANAETFALAPNGTFSYTPKSNFNGQDTFQYKVNDGTADSNTVTVTITVNAVND